MANIINHAASMVLIAQSQTEAIARHAAARGQDREIVRSRLNDFLREWQGDAYAGMVEFFRREDNTVEVYGKTI